MRNLFYVSASPRNTETRFLKSERCVIKKSFSSRLVSKNILPHIQRVQILESFDWRWHSCHFHWNRPLSISVSEFLILFWQWRSETASRVISPRRCGQMTKMLFLCPDRMPQLIFVYGWRWLLRWLAVEGIWLLCSLSSCIKKHHLPSLFTAGLFPVSHMHLSKSYLLSLSTEIHWMNRCSWHSIMLSKGHSTNFLPILCHVYCGSWGWQNNLWWYCDDVIRVISSWARKLLLLLKDLLLHYEKCRIQCFWS